MTQKFGNPIVQCYKYSISSNSFNFLDAKSKQSEESYCMSLQVTISILFFLKEKWREMVPKDMVTFP